MIGKIIAISELNVKILLNSSIEVKIGDILFSSENNAFFEIAEIESNIAIGIPFYRVTGLKEELY